MMALSPRLMLSLLLMLHCIYEIATANNSVKRRERKVFYLSIKIIFLNFE